jgi:signal transduction histidine kinase
MSTTQRGPAIAWLAWGCWGLTLAAILAAFAFSLLDHTERTAVAGIVVGLGAISGLGALVVTRRPEIRTGWLLLAMGLAGSIGGVGWMFARYAADNGAPDWLIRSVIGASEPLWGVYFAVLLLLLISAPDGTLLSPRWRLAIYFVAAMLVVWTTAGLIGAFTVDDIAASISGSGLLEDGNADYPATVDGLNVASTLLLAISAAAAAGALFLRYRRSSGEQRQQIKWVVAGCSVALAVQFGDLTEVHAEPWAFLQDLIAMISLFALTAGFGFALFRYRLWDIDLVIRRSLVYGTLWSAIAGLYIASALALGLAVSERVPIWLAIGLAVLATLLFQPARRGLEQLADRWVFGPRQRPLKIVHDFGAQLGSAEHPGEIANQLARSSISAMPLAWVKVVTAGSAGIEIGHRREAPPLRIALLHAGERLGEFQCQALPGSSLNDEERSTLAALCAQTGTAISHALLASRIVKAQEVERRRIERNIHDGAQQELVALVARMGLARRQNGQLDHAQLLSDLQDDVRAILANLRELAQGVHPSVLADGGLAAAVEDRCSRSPLPITLQIAPELRRRFGEDIEGAAYFVVAEGLTNLLRYSGARSASVNLGLEGDCLTVGVWDDGAGFDPDSAPRGGGLRGLSDRLQAIGGSLHVKSIPGHGTELRASLPFRTAVLE